MEISQETYIVPKVFRETSSRLNAKIAMRHKQYGLWQEINWTEYYQNSLYLASGLIEFGVEPGDCIGVIGENCPEWLYIDMGTQMVGGVTVGIYTTNAWKQVQYIVDHASCKLLFAENEEQIDKWLVFKGDSPQLEKVVYWDDKGLKKLNDPQLTSFEQLIELGKTHLEKNREIIDTRIEQIQEDDMAILVYTSGTTGPPKGSMITHKNLIWAAHQFIEVEGMEVIKENENTMSFLPLCHIFERMFSVYLQLIAGHTLNFVESIDTVAQNLREIHPSIGYGVPRIWEKYYSNIYLNMRDAKPFKQLAYRVALKIGMKHAEQKLAGKKASLILSIGNFLAQYLVFYFLKERLGLEKMRYAFSGAAPISPDILKFFHAIGLPMIEGYGMTETTALLTFSTLGAFKLGTVGRPFKNTAFKISEEGEIMTRHPGVFKGYYKNPAATAQALEDGWMHTGDIGTIDDDGFVKIIDRKKDIIITAGGKNIAPQYIENKLKFSPFINDAIVIGDKRKFVSAIIVLDEDNVNKFAQDSKIQYSTYADLANHPDIRQMIDTEVQKVNKELSRVEKIRQFTILDKRLYQEDGEITPTMKVKRKFINETYSDLIEAMYQR